MDIKTYSVKKQEVINVPTPADTRTYRAMGHEKLIDLTLEGIEKSGFLLDKESYTMARKGNVANGKYTISNVADEEMQIQIGWQNSLDKSISLKWAMGVHIFICSNGCIQGDMGAFKKKHWGDIQSYTPQSIAEYIKTSADVFLNIQKERDAMKNIELTKRISAELLGRMFIEEGLIESTQLNIIKREMETPTFNYGAPNSLWELYQFTTFSMKELHPTIWMQEHIDVHKYFVGQSGLILPKQEEILSFPISQVVEDKTQLSLYEEFDKVKDFSETADY